MSPQSFVTVGERLLSATERTYQILDILADVSDVVVASSLVDAHSNLAGDAFLLKLSLKFVFLPLVQGAIFFYIFLLKL